MPGLRQQRRDDAVSRRQPRVQRLHHRPEVFLEAGRLGRGNRERVPGRAGVETEQARRGGRRADRAERRRAVPAALIVARVHRAAQPPFELEADDVGVEQRAAGRARDFRGGQRRGDERRARMRQRHEAHVVVVERVRRGAVGQRGVARARAQRACRARGTGRRRPAPRRAARSARPARRRRPASRRPCRAARAPPRARAAGGGVGGGRRRRARFTSGRLLRWRIPDCRSRT